MKAIAIILSLFCVLQVNAQSLQFEEVKTTIRGFDVESGESTGLTITIDSEIYDVFATSKGSKYIKLTSSTGNLYPLWIGEETKESYNNKPVRITSKGKYFILLTGKSGNPYCKYLKVK